MLKYSGKSSDNFLWMVKLECMDKDINCLNFKGLFGYIENRFGKAVLAKMVENAINSGTYEIPNKNTPGILEPVTLEHLVDESYWISNELSLSLLSMIKTVVPRSEERRVGKECRL